MKKTTLAAGLEAAAGKSVAIEQPTRAGKAPPGTVTIAAHFAPEVRKTLKMLEAETGRRLKPLLGEAINDLCAKYGRPQPYTVED